jgi:hypothetical protein
MDPLIAFLTEILTEEVLWPIAGAGLLNLGRQWLGGWRRSRSLEGSVSSPAPIVVPSPLPHPPLLLEQQRKAQRIYRMAQIQALAESQRTWLIWTGGLGLSFYTAITPLVPANFDNTKVALLILLSGLFFTAVVRSSLAAGLQALLRLDLLLNPELKLPEAEEDTI